MQYELFHSHRTPIAQRIPLEQGDVSYYPDWLTTREADALYDQLLQDIQWRQDTIKLFGRWVKIPRLQAWYGEQHCHYGYSGLSLAPLPMPASLESIKRKCEKTAKAPFNCVLANWYRDGQDSMSFHADDEPELGERPVIASVTFGQSRPFDFKHKLSSEKHRVLLQHGSLLVMAGDTQTYYNHGVNKSARHMASRINLTFRYIQKI
ncbi:alpha-ketoglutarate-dependent dioxygenase AlkB [Alteromonas sediminis]|uniref:Alpha-ketoglutarate-dependent dioxygenase AlkB n=1 Tax=Alteromonas sediminis TaxID=2259342 RepID=A0A3N5YAV4_9ALTE|nr:alpha-ketoglutarate-dependent dioxygenase AlkB [Alteromonas sediminis]RPJ65995.1 alpha-ketoglutarate-dependent dioxygenase AlkB [Alteromonas sediminis]